MAKKNYKELAHQILEQVGGSGNIVYCEHCMTRLRFNLKDKNLVNADALKALSGVAGTVWNGEQFQVIIGTTVGDVYQAVCTEGNLEQRAGIEENLDQPKKKVKKGFKGVVINVVNTLSECIVPIIGAYLALGLFAALTSILGPQGFGLLDAEHGLYKLFDYVQKGVQYFTPVLIAYTASRKFKCSTTFAMITACVCIYPDLIAEISAGTFQIFGMAPIPYTLNGQVIPMILSCWIMSHVEKFFNKILPESLRFVFSGFLTLLVMIPLTLYVLTPFGMIAGMAITLPVSMLANISLPLVLGAVGAIYLLLLTTGMHTALGAMLMTDFFTVGVNYTMLPVSYAVPFVCAATDLAVRIKSKNEETKKLGVSGIITNILGGVAEPSLYSIYIKNPNVMIAASAGLASAGIVHGIMNVGVYALSSGNFLSVVGYMAGGLQNFYNAIPGLVVGSVVAFVMVMILGVESNPKK